MSHHEICRDFLKGACNRPGCRFSHSDAHFARGRENHASSSRDDARGGGGHRYERGFDERGFDDRLDHRRGRDDRDRRPPRDDRDRDRDHRDRGDRDRTPRRSHGAPEPSYDANGFDRRYQNTAPRGAGSSGQVRSPSHRSPYDPVCVVNADP